VRKPPTSRIGSHANPQKDGLAERAASWQRDATPLCSAQPLCPAVLHNFCGVTSAKPTAARRRRTRAMPDAGYRAFALPNDAELRMRALPPVLAAAFGHEARGMLHLESQSGGCLGIGFGAGSEKSETRAWSSTGGEPDISAGHSNAGRAGAVGRDGNPAVAAAGDLADQLARGQRPEAGSASSCGATRATSSAISASSVDGLRQLAHVAKLVARDPDPCGLLASCQASRDPSDPLLRQQGAAREGLLGPQVVQVPEQVVVDGGAHPHQPFAVIDQQPDVELNAPWGT
jgi:hypothetical protein